MMQKRLNPNGLKEELPKPNYAGVAAQCFAFGVVIYMTSIRETIATPLVTDQYGLEDEKGVFYVSIALSTAGFLSIFIFLFASKITKKYDERKIMIILGFIPVVIGVFLHYPMGNTDIVTSNCTQAVTTESTVSEANLIYLHGVNSWKDSQSNTSSTSDPYSSTDVEENCLGCPIDTQAWCLTTPQITPPQLIVSYLIAVLGYPIAMSLSQTVFSKILGPKPQGLWMGLLTGCGSLARVTGPIWISVVYEQYGTIATYMILGGLETAATLLLILSFRNLSPMTIGKVPMKGKDNNIAEETV